ncbi:MAG: hypothetical protein R3B47_12285 [Bacteroidia bacterium]
MLWAIPAFEGIVGHRFSNSLNLGIGTGIRWYSGGLSVNPGLSTFGET